MTFLTGFGTIFFCFPIYMPASANSFKLFICVKESGQKNFIYYAEYELVFIYINMF